jgi:hypothetical protein
LEQTELEKCKSDVVYFGEKYLGIELLPWQKTYLRLLQKGNKVCFIGSRYGKSMMYDIKKRYEQLK